MEADTYTPVLRAHDRYGRRVDEVDFHPAWHALMNEAVSAACTQHRGQVPILRTRDQSCRVSDVVPVGSRARMPDLHDVRRGASPER